MLNYFNSNILSILKNINLTIIKIDIFDLVLKNHKKILIFK